MKPSCAAMKFTLRVAGGGYTSDDPAIAVPKAPSMWASPRQNRRTRSR